MKHPFAAALAAPAVAVALAACVMPFPDSQRWVTLIDGDKGLDNFNRVGDANWRTEGGAVVADKGKGGHLVSKKSYRDFELRVQFYAEPTTNSGIFMRCQDANKITDRSCYEANIFDQRPGQEYATGGIVNFAIVSSPQKAGGKWNEYVIRAEGPNVTVWLNGVTTVHMVSNEFASGPFTLQFGNRGKEPGGAIKWRKVQIKEL